MHIVHTSGTVRSVRTFCGQYWSSHCKKNYVCRSELPPKVFSNCICSSQANKTQPKENKSQRVTRRSIFLNVSRFFQVVAMIEFLENISLFCVDLAKRPRLFASLPYHCCHSGRLDMVPVSLLLQMASPETKYRIDLCMKKDTTFRAGYFTTISGHFFAKYIYILHKTEVQIIILMCLTSLNPNWVKSYDINHKKFWRLCFSIL